MQINSTGGGKNYLYAIKGRQKKEDSSYNVTGIIQGFDFSIYAFLNPRDSLYFVTLYDTMNFNFTPDKLTEPFNFSTLLVTPF